MLKANRLDSQMGLISKSVCSTSSHSVPDLPGGHIHLNDPISSIHVLPKVHGSDIHSFISKTKIELSYNGVVTCSKVRINTLCNSCVCINGVVTCSKVRINTYCNSCVCINGVVTCSKVRINTLCNSCVCINGVVTCSKVRINT
jgi:hypothetical protein